MSQLTKGIALFVVVVCLVWLGVLWHWDSTRRAMVVEDIVLYLGLLPVVVFGLLLLLRWAWRSAVLRQSAAISAEVAAAAALASGGPAAAAPLAELPQAEAAERHLRAQLLASGFSSTCGTTGADVMGAVKDGRPLPEPDAQLRDDDGLPVLCARLADLPKLDFEAALTAAQAKNEAWTTDEPREHVLRALAALSEPLAQTVMGLAPWQAHFTADPQRRLRVVLAWPENWTEFEQACADAWAQAWLQDNAPEFARPWLRVMHSQRHSGVQMWRQVDQLMLAMARENRDDPVLVAACHSDISSAAVDALEREQRLFSAARNNKGQMPGEAAAVLLLAGAQWPGIPDRDDSARPPQLHRAAFAQRNKSVDGEGRVASDVLQAALGQAMMVAQMEAAQMQCLVSDADRHSARCQELMGASLALLPHFDASLDVALLATQLGSTGAAGLLLTIATAAAYAGKRQGPCIAVSVAEPLQRLVLVARPASLESTAA
jgi:hypothetical protein